MSFAPAQGTQNNPVSLLELSTDPTGLNNTGFVYTNDVAGITELMYKEDLAAGATEVQITSDGAINAVAVGFGAASASRMVVTDAAGLITTSANATYGATTGNLSLTQTVQTTGSPIHISLISGAHTTLTASTESSSMLFDLSATVEFATGALTNQRALRILAPTYGFVGASTLTNAATVYIDAAPTAGTNATLTNAYALWVDAGSARIDGVILGGDGLISAAQYSFLSEPNSGMYLNGANDLRLTANGVDSIRLVGGNSIILNGLYPLSFGNGGMSGPDVSLQRGGADQLDLASGDSLHILGGHLLLVENVNTSGTPTALTVTGAAHTTLATTVEAPGVLFDASATKQWATGAITSQREFKFLAPTYGFVGASTITTAATVYIDAAPTAGTNATLTDTHALWVDAGTTRLDGTILGADGLVATPMYGFLSDPDTGMYLYGSAQLGWSIAGVIHLYMSSTELRVPSDFSFGFTSANADSVLDIMLSRAALGSLEVTQAIATTGAPTLLTLTASAHTTLTASGEVETALFDASATKEWATGAITSQREFKFLAPTYGFVGASTITNAATVYIDAAPAAGTNATLTNAYALWVDAGDIRSDGVVIHAAGSQSAPSMSFIGDLNTGIWTNGGDKISFSTGAGFHMNLAVTTLTVASDVSIGWSSDTSAGNAQDTTLTRSAAGVVGAESLILTELVLTSGTPTAFTVTGAAHTTLATTVEAPGVLFDASATKEWATGAITSQREFKFLAPTYAFAGASTITNAATVYIDAAPTAGTNATLTNSYALWVDAGTVKFDGTLICDTINSAASTDLTVRAPSGQTTFFGAFGANIWKIDSALAGWISLGNYRMSHGTSALATTATEAFFHLNSCAGTPTGVPASIPTGQIPMVYDTTGEKLWVYNGGWVGVVLS
ncbi:hypothetical protein [uncultured Mediterranean phage]|nr:hypothetical protein [uncultured Mediterranean phage]